jgi:hypothetical protein
MTSVRMLVKGVLDDTVSVEIRAFLKTFVFALPAILFGFDVCVSCENRVRGKYP